MSSSSAPRVANFLSGLPLYSEEGKKLEPYEEAQVEVPEEYMSSAIDLMNRRKGMMMEMSAGEGNSSTQTVKYRIPTRGLIGLRNSLLTATRGTVCAFEYR